MIGKILVPLDGSDQAEAILPYVSTLAKGLEIPVLLLSVLDQGSLGMGRSIYSKLYETAEVGARNRLHDVAHRLAQEGVDAQEAVAAGKPAKVGYGERSGGTHQKHGRPGHGGPAD